MAHLSWCFCSNLSLSQWSDIFHFLSPSSLSLSTLFLSVLLFFSLLLPFLLTLLPPLTKHLLMSPYTLDIILTMQTKL